jgi:hypothetical protein
VEQQQAPEHAADGGVNQQEAGPADEEQEDKGSRKRKRAGSLAEPPAVKPAAAAAHEDDTDHEDEPAVGSDGEHSSHSHSYSSIRGHSSSGSEGSELDSDQEAGSDGDVLGTLDGDMEDEAAAAAAAAGDAMEALRDVIEGDSEVRGAPALGRCNILTPEVAAVSRPVLCAVRQSVMHLSCLAAFVCHGRGEGGGLVPLVVQHAVRWVVHHPLPAVLCLCSN